MKICRFDAGRVGVVEGDYVVDVTGIVDALPKSAWPYPRHDVFIAALEELKPELARLAAAGKKIPLKDVKLLSPVANPGKIIGAPVNYKLHLEEGKADAGINFGMPVKTIDEAGLFLKANSALVGPGEGIVSTRTDRRTDHEIEIGVVIGKGGKDIAQADALKHVAGYALALDMTIRGPEERSMRKSLDSFAVLGPWLVTADEFGSPENVKFELKIGGKVRQSSNTSLLIYDVAKLISYSSAHYTLEPGDIIMTGTPEGVAPIEPGDVLECWGERIGSMSVAVRA